MTQEPVRAHEDPQKNPLSAPGSSVPSTDASRTASGSGAAVRAADSPPDEKVPLGPYIPLYWDDLLGGTMSYGADEFGAYLLLLGYQWSNGGIENVPIIIERISRCEYSRLPRVLSKFAVNADGMLRNARMEEVRNKRIAYVKSRKDAADKRWNNVPTETHETQKPMHTDMHTHNHTDMRSGMHKGDIPFPSPSPEEIEERERARARLEAGSASGTIEEQVSCIQAARTEWKLRAVDVQNVLASIPDDKRSKMVAEFVADVANMIEPPRSPIGYLRGYARKTMEPGKNGKVDITKLRGKK